MRLVGSTGRYELHQHYKKQCNRMLQALSKVLLGAGDLHLCLFHILCAVYRSSWGCFLQPICMGLGYKRIAWKKIEKCYEHASLLVLQVLARVEGRLVQEFVAQLEDT
jgi:hypothetical protein